MIKSLIPKQEFIGLENVSHLAMGGESPMLRSHMDVMAQFMLDKSQGEPARDLQAAVMQQAKDKSAQLIKVPTDDITFLSSATDGINVVAYGLDWRSGDNVVVADVEFPSDILPWTKLKQQGVEIRIVRNQGWVIEEQAILDQVDDRTRVVAISQVSMFTGQQMDVKTLSNGIHKAGALLLLDVTHAAGVVPVDASLADFAVSSCYKWLLGTHGTAIFYCNHKTMPDFEPPFIGWASIDCTSGWRDPLDFKLHQSADRFLPANPSYISIYVLNNALQKILDLGETAIFQHALALSALVRQGLAALGYELMTPGQDHRRAGNVCFLADNKEPIRQALTDNGVLVWGAHSQFGRLRVSTHVHNDSDDVDRFLMAMKSLGDA